MSNAAQKYCMEDTTIGLSSIRAIVQANLQEVVSYTELDGKFTIRFNSPNKASELLESIYCAMTTQSTKTRPMYWHLDHAWWPLIRPMFCYSDGMEIAKSNASIKYISVGSSDVDNFVGSFYKKININGVQAAPRVLSNDTWLLDRLTVTQKFDPTVRSEIQSYYDKAKNYDDFNSSQFIKEFLEMKSPFEVNINWSDNEKIINQFDSFFE